jgi:hypothetical protein
MQKISATFVEQSNGLPMGTARPWEGYSAPAKTRLSFCAQFNSHITTN